MSFSKLKKDSLFKKDKSRKGEIDQNARGLVDLINSLPNYYTTSSCSGRIVLLRKQSDKKNDAKWLFVRHNAATHKEIGKVIKNVLNQNKGDIWFREEPIILHICCNDLNSAKHLLNIARKTFKRAGIIALGKRIVVEIRGTEFIEAILIRDNKLLIKDNYLRILIKEANKKLKRNNRNIKLFFNELNAANPFFG